MDSKPFYMKMFMTVAEALFTDGVDFYITLRVASSMTFDMIIQRQTWEIQENSTTKDNERSGTYLKISR